ncbi:hypothetical protein QQF64_017588 [Cirrhinus molitorella]|uniref:Uncharacterized protein n=1 Tax=Cirrhinus molitorella TaxID=172907 RepID=A0ABR3LKN2_9TELE
MNHTRRENVKSDEDDPAFIFQVGWMDEFVIVIIVVIGRVSRGWGGAGGGLVGRVTNYFLKQTYENHTAQGETTGRISPHHSAHSLPAPSSNNKRLYPPSLSLCCRQTADKSHLFEQRPEIRKGS